MGYREYPPGPERIRRLAVRLAGTPDSELERLGTLHLFQLQSYLQVAVDELDLLPVQGQAP